MFNFFSDLRDSIVAVNGEDIDKALNELVAGINSIENKVEFVLQEKQIENEIEDGFVQVRNNSISTIENIPINEGVKLNKIVSEDRTFLTTNNNSHLQPAKIYSIEGEYIKMGQYGHYLSKTKIINPKRTILSNSRHLQNNMISLRHVNWEKLKERLIKIAYDKLNLPKPVNKVTEMDYDTMSDNLRNKIEVPDKAIKDNSITIGNIPNTHVYEKDTNINVLENYVKNTEFTISDLFRLNTNVFKQVKGNLSFNVNQLQIVPNDYKTSTYNDKFKLPIDIVTLNLTYKNFSRNLSANGYQLRTGVDHKTGKVTFNVAIFTGKINKTKLSKEIRDRIGL